MFTMDLVLECQDWGWGLRGKTRRAMKDPRSR